jgi:hypothetical protein
MKIKDKRTRRFLCRSIITCCATTVARRVTMQTGVPMGTMMMRHQLDQDPATIAGLTALDGVASMMMVSHYSKREA